MMLAAACAEKPILPNALPEFGTFRMPDGGTLTLSRSSITSANGTLLAVDSDTEGTDFVVKRLVRGRLGRDGAWYAGTSCTGRLVIREKELVAAFSEAPCDTLTGRYVLEPEKALPAKPVATPLDAGPFRRLSDPCGRLNACVCELATSARALDQVGSYDLDELCRSWRVKPMRDQWRCGHELDRLGAMSRSLGLTLPWVCEP